MEPFRVRVTGSGSGTLGAVVVQAELVDHVDGCLLPDGPWQLFEPESLDAIYTDGDAAFWPDTSGNGRNIDGVFVGIPSDPEPGIYRENLLAGFGGMRLLSDEGNFASGTYHSDRAAMEPNYDDVVVKDIGDTDGLTLLTVINVAGDRETEDVETAVLHFFATDTDTGTFASAFGIGRDYFGFYFFYQAMTSLTLNDPADGWYVVSGSVEEGQSRLWVNRQEVATGSGSDFPARFWNIGYQWNRGMVFSAIYDRAFTPAEHDDAHCALMGKFGL